eukprot:TRINITY_DN106200_c0_g1_i1.p1 TRINITY_DN106200_c0_g1~~TRINITY_DN106200_c0_g1_i1.p1  ORF type:complete len:413 (+),score=66.23 TRINITY_DN106200_c0_g1_i1:42-1241(+)
MACRVATWLLLPLVGALRDQVHTEEGPPWLEKLKETFSHSGWRDESEIREVQLAIDTTFTSQTEQYRLTGFNCAHWAGLLLQGYGIECSYPMGLALPHCRCHHERGCSAGMPKPEGSDLSPLLTLFKHHHGGMQTNQMDRLMLHLHEPRASEELLHARHFQLEVVKTFVPKDESYHVSTICSWMAASGHHRHFLSWSGWPFDTIASTHTLQYLWSGNFTVAFPDPTVHRYIDKETNQGLEALATLSDDTTQVAKLPNARHVWGCMSERRGFVGDRHHHVLSLTYGGETRSGKYEADAFTVEFFEMQSPEVFFKVFKWPVVKLTPNCKPPEKQPFDFTGGHMPMDTAILLHEGIYYLQRPLISRWIYTYLQVLLDKERWSVDVLGLELKDFRDDFASKTA